MLCFTAHLHVQAWVSFLDITVSGSGCARVHPQMHGVMTGFGRLSILVDENTHAFHFFITALLQVGIHLSGLRRS